MSSAAVAVPIHNPANGHFYELIDIGSVTWDTANADAQTQHLGSHRGYLVSITSAEEQAWIVANISPPFGSYIGGFQADKTNEPLGGWTWTSGEVWSYTNWAVNEPNNVNGGTEDCAQFWTNDGWNDIPCNNPSFVYTTYVVEYNGGAVIPALSTWALLALALLLGWVGYRRVRIK